MGGDNIKIMIPIILSGILFVSGFGAIAQPFENINKEIKFENIFNSSYNDEIDQYQTELVQNIFLPIGRLDGLFSPPVNFSVAQSFIPQKEILSKVALLVTKNTSTSQPLVLAIREDLTQKNLATIRLNPNEFQNLNYSWIEFDFDDLPVTINKTYYIVAYTANVSENYYIWGANNNYDSYEFGCAWLSIDGETWVNESAINSVQNKFLPFTPRKKPIRFGESWRYKTLESPRNENFTWDMCFITFGRNEPPIVDIISPRNALYIANEELFDFFEPLIFGIIKVIVDAYDHSGIEKVEFYINDVYVGNATESPYTWIWSDRAFFKHFLKVIATDNIGLFTEYEIEVWKFF